MKSLALQVGIAKQYMYVLGWWSDVNDLSHLSHSYPLITYEVSCEYLNLILKIEAILLIWNFKRVTSLVLVIMQPKVCINIHHCNISYHDISCTDCPIPSTCSHTGVFLLNELFFLSSITWAYIIHSEKNILVVLMDWLMVDLHGSPPYTRVLPPIPLFLISKPKKYNYYRLIINTYNTYWYTMYQPGNNLQLYLHV